MVTQALSSLPLLPCAQYGHALQIAQGPATLGLAPVVSMDDYRAHAIAHENKITCFKGHVPAGEGPNS